MITISNDAANKFNEKKLKFRNPDNMMLRVSYEAGCWSESAFSITLDELKKVNDTVVESNGVKIVYESRIANMLNGFVIEYSNSFFSKGFYLELLRSSK